MPDVQRSRPRNLPNRSSRTECASAPLWRSRGGPISIRFQLPLAPGSVFYRNDFSAVGDWGMGDVTFERAELADLPAIIALLADDALGQQREDVGPPANPKYEAAFHAINNDGNQLLAVARQGTDVVGCLQISFIPGLSRTGQWRGQIESVRVASTARGGGLGRRVFGVGDIAMSRARLRTGTADDRQIPPRGPAVLSVSWLRCVPRRHEAQLRGVSWRAFLTVRAASC